MSKVWFVTGAQGGTVNAALTAGSRIVAIGRSMAKLRLNATSAQVALSLSTDGAC